MSEFQNLEIFNRQVALDLTDKTLLSKTFPSMLSKVAGLDQSFVKDVIDEPALPQGTSSNTSSDDDFTIQYPQFRCVLTKNDAGDPDRTFDILHDENRLVKGVSHTEELHVYYDQLNYSENQSSASILSYTAYNARRILTAYVHFNKDPKIFGSSDDYYVDTKTNPDVIINGNKASGNVLNSVLKTFEKEDDSVLEYPPISSHRITPQDREIIEDWGRYPNNLNLNLHDKERLFKRVYDVAFKYYEFIDSEKQKYRDFFDKEFIDQRQNNSQNRTKNGLRPRNWSVQNKKGKWAWQDYLKEVGRRAQEDNTQTRFKNKHNVRSDEHERQTNNDDVNNIKVYPAPEDHRSQTEGDFKPYDLILLHVVMESPGHSFLYSIDRLNKKIIRFNSSDNTLAKEEGNDDSIYDKRISKYDDQYKPTHNTIRYEISKIFGGQYFDIWRDFFAGYDLYPDIGIGTWQDSQQAETCVPYSIYNMMLMAFNVNDIQAKSPDDIKVSFNDLKLNEREVSEFFFRFVTNNDYFLEKMLPNT